MIVSLKGSAFLQPDRLGMRVSGPAGSFMPFDVGFNFRNTLAFVTDPAGTAGMISANSSYSPLPYPQTSTINGVSVTYGIAAAFSANDNARDRDNTIDPRLAGCWFQANNGTQAVWEVQVPASGTYMIHLAMGDAIYSRTGSQVEVFDGSTPRLTVSGNPTGGSFYDATGTLYTAANWPTHETGVLITMTGTTLYVAIGPPSNVGSETDFAHLRIVRVS